MASREQQLQKDKGRALGELLVAECRMDEPNEESMATILESGADVCYKHSLALYWAAKKLKFRAVEFLVRHGALGSITAKSYIANMCNMKTYSEAHEKEFFAIIDLCYNKNENYIELFTPYINRMAGRGNEEKLRELMKRYYLTESEVASAVYIRIIFETIVNGYENILQFIDRRVNWMTEEAFNLAVSSGEWEALAYMYDKGVKYEPSVEAVAQAVFSSRMEVLGMLVSVGFSFCRREIFLSKACLASKKDGGEALRFLLENGYKLTDSYNGKTIKQILENK